MAFITNSSKAGTQVPTMGQLYAYGKTTQTQFQCGWNMSYLNGYSARKPVDFTNFGKTVLSVSRPNDTAPPPNQTKLAASATSAPEEATYFMAGRSGCGFVKRAHEQHVLQKKAVVELNCVHPEVKHHKVCQMNALARRGTPAYYKKTDQDQYELVHMGFTKDLSFMS